LSAVWEWYAQQEHTATHDPNFDITTACLLVFDDRHVKPEFCMMDIHALQDRFGEFNRNTRTGMHPGTPGNIPVPGLRPINRVGSDVRRGKFVAFDLQTAKDLVTLIVENSFVMFGPHIYHQRSGIPMGTNPAVFMANLFLNHFELAFVRQLVQLLEHHPPSGADYRITAPSVLRQLVC